MEPILDNEGSKTQSSASSFDRKREDLLHQAQMENMRQRGEIENLQAANQNLQAANHELNV